MFRFQAGGVLIGSGQEGSASFCAHEQTDCCALTSPSGTGEVKPPRTGSIIHDECSFVSQTHRRMISSLSRHRAVAQPQIKCCCSQEVVLTWRLIRNSPGLHIEGFKVLINILRHIQLKKMKVINIIQRKDGGRVARRQPAFSDTHVTVRPTSNTNTVQTSHTASP